MIGERVLVGHTGFVGQSLLRQARFDRTFNRGNIHRIGESESRLLVCAAAPAEKWRANTRPAEDRANIERLMDSLREARVDEIVLVSTIDVYPSPVKVDEETPIRDADGHPYGRHRLALETFVREEFPRHLIMRLPGLFGKGLKKNMIFDLLTTGRAPFTHPDSVFQYYDMRWLWSDIEKARGQGLAILNVATEPLRASEIARLCVGSADVCDPQREIVTYDMRTLHAGRMGARGHYLYSGDHVRQALTDYAKGGG